MTDFSFRWKVVIGGTRIKEPKEQYLFVGSWPLPAAEMYKRPKWWAGSSMLPISFPRYAPEEQMRAAIEDAVRAFLVAACDKGEAE